MWQRQLRHNAHLPDHSTSAFLMENTADPSPRHQQEKNPSVPLKSSHEVMGNFLKSSSVLIYPQWYVDLCRRGEWFLAKRCRQDAGWVWHSLHWEKRKCAYSKVGSLGSWWILLKNIYNMEFCWHWKIPLLDGPNHWLLQKNIICDNKSVCKVELNLLFAFGLSNFFLCSSPSRNSTWTHNFSCVKCSTIWSWSTTYQHEWKKLKTF